MTNEIQLKITGSANIPNGLELGKEYDLTLSNVECRKSEEHPNDDGSVNKVFTVKLSPFSEVNIISEKEIIKGKAKGGSMSQVIRRFICFDLYAAESPNCTPDEFYQKIQSEFLESLKIRAEK